MRKRIEVIQLLRGFAAIMVCFYHMKTMLNFPSFKLGEMLFGHGDVGVPLFFIISGFIMVFTTQKNDGTFGYARDFMIKRIIRIVPLYYSMTLLWMIADGTLSFYFVERPDLLIRTLLFQPSFLNHAGSSFGMPPLIVGWSLNYEMLFYVVFAFTLFFKRFRYYVIFTFFGVMVFLVPFLHHGYVSLDSSRYYEYPFQYLNILTNSTLLLFLSGVVFGLIYLSEFQIKSGKLLFTLLGLSLAFFFFIFFFNPEPLQPTIFTLLSCGSLVFLVLMVNKKYDFTLPRPLVYLGDMSYSIYLVHPVIINYFSDYFKAIGLAYFTRQPLFFFEATAMIILFGMLCHKYIEKQLTGWLQAKLIKKKSMSVPVKIK